MKKRSVDDFVIGGCIGEGSYSRVFRAVSKTTRETYAIKILNKQHIHQEQKRKYVTIEKDTLNLLGQHDGIVTLYYTFQDSKRLYFVIDYASNGELLGLIHKYGSLSERVVKYYTVQLVDALGFIHEKGVIHRDLKPENILLNSEWKVMITDFGAARVLSESGDGEGSQERGESSETNGRKGSFVGTAEYVTPELLERNECGFESDYWALGCIIYQMILGRPPFKESSDYETFLKIVNLDYEFPAKVPIPKVMEDLIVNLLRLEPAERFKLEEIQAHRWFRGVKWGDWRTIWGQRVPKFESYDASPLMVLSEVKTGLNLRREIDNGRSNKKLMDKVVTRPIGRLPSAPVPPPIANTAVNAVGNTVGGMIIPPLRKVSSDAISAAGAVARGGKSIEVVNPVLLEKAVPKVIRDKLLLHERILKLDNIVKSEMAFRGDANGQPLTDEVLQGVIKRNEFALERSRRVCILVVTSSARLFIYELESGAAQRAPVAHNGSTLVQAREFYSSFMEIKLTNSLVSLYDYEFDEDSGDGYLVLELNNVNKLVFLRQWQRSVIAPGGLAVNVRVGFRVGERESWVNTLLRAKEMVKRR